MVTSANTNRPGKPFYPGAAWLAGVALSMGCHYKVVAFGEIDRRAAEEVVARVVRIRGLAPREPVRFQAVSARALRRELEADLSRLKASGQLETWRKAWSRLGLLAADVDLERAYADLYSDEPAGYYDSETRRMRIVVKDRVRTEVMEVVGLLRRRDPIYGEALAHETVHALQDQKWHLTALEHAQQDDERLARRALVEGDASKVGFAYGALFFSSFESFSEFVAARIDTVNAGDTTPPWLRDNFQFPYVWGSLFVEKLYARGGWAAVDAAYERPPRSSEQILHPEKYLGPAPDPPRPVPIELPRPDGWKRIYSTTLGELGTRALVGRAAALGWGGDHAEVWEDGAGRLALAWATVWDDEAAAARFEAAYREHAGRVSEPFAMVRRGQRLAIVRGVEAAATVEAALTPPAP